MLFDVYSTIPLPIIYIIGATLLAWIIWSFARDAIKADNETRKKLVKFYVGLAIFGIVLFGGLNYFKVSEKLFPSFYEQNERQEQLNEYNFWEENYNPEDWQRPLNEARITK